MPVNLLGSCLINSDVEVICESRNEIVKQWMLGGSFCLWWLVSV